ncbi:MAG: TPM domain-containing protein, partial [Treponema sp.]|nr:TPM domain-containing protein [Treponema sp.]
MVLNIANCKKNSCSQKFCKKLFSKVVFAFLVYFFALPVFALDVPYLSGRVVDNAGIISDAGVAQITNYLEELENTTGAQIAVLTIPSLQDDDLEMFSMRVVESWKLGQAKEDNGALLLIAWQEKKIRIEIGYGLEGVLTDAKCGLIIRNVIAPFFQSGKYDEGIFSAVQYMGGIISEDEEIINSRALTPSSSNGSEIAVAIFFAFFFFVLFMMIMLTIKAAKTGGTRPRVYVGPSMHTFGGSSGFDG